MSTEERGIEESTTEPSSRISQQPNEQEHLPPVTSPQSPCQGPEPVSPDSGLGITSSVKATPRHATATAPNPTDQNTSDTTYPSTPEGGTARPKQVIAVNASKGPAAFFNLARKFLVVDEVCDLSALEGAIVSAADAAHLLERSQLATIVRVQTSYAAVEPKRRRQQQHTPYSGRQQPQQNRELRRARIVITVKRTEQYKRWLDENPFQAVLAGDGTVDDEETAAEDAPETPPSMV